MIVFGSFHSLPQGLGTPFSFSGLSSDFYLSFQIDRMLYRECVKFAATTIRFIQEIDSWW
jgi:hypothetical protein